jgi:hypothetical protein
LVRSKDVIAAALRIDDAGTFKSKKRKKINHWFYDFLEWKGLSIRRVTRVGHKLTGHLAKVQTGLAEAICKRFRRGGTLRKVRQLFF